MVGPRRRAREIALQVLHVIDVSPEVTADAAMERTFEHLMTARGLVEDEDDAAESGDSGDVLPARADRAMVEELVRGVEARRPALDETLTALSRNWRLERIAVVERNIIRLALWELLHAPNVPVNVVLDEAIELCKRFGTAEGAAFVNGLLDRAVTDLSIQR
jgi:transcription antitermination protein NusB